MAQIFEKHIKITLVEQHVQTYLKIHYYLLIFKDGECMVVLASVDDNAIDKQPSSSQGG